MSSSLLEEVEFLARLEIESILDSHHLGEYAVSIEEQFGFPMIDLISEYFVEGASFGVLIDDVSLELEKDLYLLQTHEHMRTLLRNSSFQHTDEEKAIELFERIFLQGMYWSITHQENNRV